MYFPETFKILGLVSALQFHREVNRCDFSVFILFVFHGTLEFVESWVSFRRAQLFMSSPSEIPVPVFSTHPSFRMSPFCHLLSPVLYSLLFLLTLLPVPGSNLSLNPSI